MTNDLLPDEIWVKPAMGPCSDNGEVAGVWTSEEQSCLDCPVKYIRADLVSTPNKTAEVDLDALKRVVRGEKEGRYDMDYTYDLGWNAAIRAVQASGHLATGKGGGGKDPKTGIKYSDAIKELQEMIADCDAHGTRAKTPLPVRVRVLCDVIIHAATQPAATAQIDAVELAELQTALDFISENGIEMSNEGIPHIRTAIKAARAHLEKSKGGV